jgi:excisionase family DNA binding protein
MPEDRNARLAFVLADPQRIADLQVDDMPLLLGALEQLRAALWARMLSVPVPAAREPGIDVGEEILTVPEVAAELRFTRGYVYEAVRRGDLTAVRKGKYVRIRRTDLRAWLEGHPPRSLDARPASPDSSRQAPKREGPPSLSSGIARVSRRAHVRAGPVREPSGAADP